MASKKSTLDQFQENALTEEAIKEIKGGEKNVPGYPGGAGSTGIIDWGEIEIRHHFTSNEYLKKGR
jgi:hypothetical protein